MTQIFCDIADLKEIKKYNSRSIVKGFTTNPTLMRKAGAKNYIQYCKQILKKIDKKTKVIISIFAGRMADVGKDPIPEFIKSIRLAKKFKNVKILWASTREPYNYLQSKQLGCHIITIPPNIIEKIERYGKSFNQLTINTVKAFLEDSKKSKFKI